MRQRIDRCLADCEFCGPHECAVVFAPAGKVRPKILDSGPGTGHTMQVCKRAER